MIPFLKITLLILAGLSTAGSILHIRALKQPTTPFLWMLKVYTSALAPLHVLIGLLSIITGIFTGSITLLALGLWSTWLYSAWLFRLRKIFKKSDSLFNAYAPDSELVSSSGYIKGFLRSPLALFLPGVKSPDFRQNIVFSRIPGTDRELVCDLWLPPGNVKRSGLTFIYFHGAAWYILDKDFGTRTFFKHLAAQGHVIMDVANRLFPETDMTGMVEDVYRAIAWIKDNAGMYAVDPERIVVGGGSSGGHISMLAAYALASRQFIPAELRERELSVRGVISLYGPSNLTDVYYQTGQHMLKDNISPEKKQNSKAAMPPWVSRMMGENYHRLGFDKGSDIGMLAKLLGCHPEECPDLYDKYSPVSYVHPGCPSTLFMQGMHDIITPVKSSLKLKELLHQAGVPLLIHLLPQTDHAFDLILPKISPVAHTVYYTVERFLATMSLQKSNSLLQSGLIEQ